MRLRLFIGLMLLWLPGKVLAFGSIGHQQVCSLAYQLVKPDTRQQIDLLLALGPEQTLAQGCVWPDEARREQAYQFTTPFHYLNVPRQQTQVKPADCAANGCLLSALQHYAALLKQGGQNRQRAEALLFYSHFVADLHQPLHVSYADDLGGNKTAVYYFGKPSNLHGIWDTAMLKSLGYADNQQLAATKLATLRPIIVRQWQSGQPLNWAQQSLAQTRRVYQSYKPGMLFSQPELDRDGPLIETRLLQAAVRLAWQLDQLLQPATGN